MSEITARIKTPDLDAKVKISFGMGTRRAQAWAMGSGLIRTAAATTANVSEQDALESICPKDGMIIGDKAYCLKSTQETMIEKGCHSGAILKNNNVFSKWKRRKTVSRFDKSSVTDILAV